MTAEEIQKEIDHLEKQLRDHVIVGAQIEGSIIAFRHVLGKITAPAAEVAEVKQ